MTEVKPCISKHIFLLPFIWTHATEPSKNSIDSFCSYVTSSQSWAPDYFNRLKSKEEYAEYLYFYPNVRDAMYEFDASSSSIIKHLEYKLSGPATFTIKVPEKLFTATGLKTVYTLNICSIFLNIYSTGVAILSISLINTEYTAKEEILAINQFGRRTFPSFLDGEIKDGIIRNHEMPVEVCISIKGATVEDGEQGAPGDNIEFKENFQSRITVHNAQTEQEPFIETKELNSNKLLPDYLLRLIFNKLDPEYIINPVLDDRMFVICWYKGDTDIYTELASGYDASDFWYKFLFTDVNQRTIWNKQQQENIIQKNSYTRWLQYRCPDPYNSTHPLSPTLYGMSRHSFVCLSGSPLAEIHMSTLYYKMAELCLLQRASVIHFTNQVSAITGKFKNTGVVDDSPEKEVERLYIAYIRFVNKIYFREITHQDQGIELYDLMQKTLRIPSFVNDLGNEIEELNRLIAGRQDAKQTEKTVQLTRIATFYLPASVGVSILGANIIPAAGDINNDFSQRSLWYLIISLVAISIACFFIIKSLKKNK